MDILKQLNAAVQYIERNLCAEFSFDELARIACVTGDSFQRFFSYMTGVTLNEYMRRRRLTLAADDLRKTPYRIIDIAVKYGYDNADAFSRAFARQHGIAPAAYRRHGGRLRVYPPVSFHISVKGADGMDFEVIQLEETRVFGISGQFEGMGYSSREALRHAMWDERGDDIPGKLCEGRWNEGGNHAYDGLWYGIWQGGRYMIAREQGVNYGALEQQVIPAGTYAAFRTQHGGSAWEELPRLFEAIFDSWLPSSGYRQRGDLIIERYHLWTDHEMREKNRYYEV